MNSNKLKEDTEFIKSKITSIQDWPKPGVIYRDITTLLSDNEGMKKVIEILHNRYKHKQIDVIIGIEARGFILGAILADKLNLGFVPIRKPGKLPRETVSEEYKLEYGTDKIELHKDAFSPGQKVLLVDDLIATGGTAIAACNLIEKLGGMIEECCFIVDLPDLKGSKKLKNKAKVFSLVEFESN